MKIIAKDIIQINDEIIVNLTQVEEIKRSDEYFTICYGSGRMRSLPVSLLDDLSKQIEIMDRLYND